MQELILKENNELTEREQAIKLHENILTHASLAAEHIVEFYKSLKQMRDSESYRQLGYEKFGDYTQTELKINQRQAYNYISALENLGEEYISLNQSYGVSKLALLASVSIEEREELEKIDIESTSVKELQEKIKNMQQQIDVFTTEKAELKNKLNERVDSAGFETSEMAMQRLEEQEAAISAAKRNAVEEARKELAVEIEELTREREQAERSLEEFKDEAEELKEQTALVQKQAEELRAQADELRSDQERLKRELELEKKQIKIDEETAGRLAEERAKRESLEKQLKVSQNPIMTEFKFKLKNLQDEFKTVHSFALSSKEDNKKLCSALKVVMLNLIIKLDNDEEEEEQ